MKKLLLTLLVLALLGAGYFYFQKKQPVVTFVPYENAQLHDRTVTVDPASQKIFDTRIAATKKTIAAFTKDTPTDDKVNNYFNLAGDEEALGHYKEAKKALEQALLAKNDAHILHAYALLLYLMGAKGDALQYLDDAIKQAPDVPNFWQTKIQLSQELYKGNANLINDVYLEGLKSTKEDIDLITLYATYLASVGRKTEAITYWQKALEKNPA